MSNSASVWRSYLLAAVVAVGLTTAWALVVAFAASVAQSTRYGQGVYEQIYIGVDGEPYILRNTRGIYSPAQEVTTLDGEAAEVDTQSLLSPLYVNPPPRDGDRPALAPYAQLQLAAVNDGGSPPEYWYLVHDGRPGGRVYGVGYHSLTKQIVGYFGRQGFTERKPPRSEWFVVAGDTGLAFATPSAAYAEPRWSEDHVLYWLADGKLWSADPAKRELRTLTEAPQGATVGWAMDLSQGPQERPRGSYATTAWAPRELVLRADDALTLVHPQTGESATYALPADLRKGMLSVVRLPEEKLLVADYQYTAEPPTTNVAWLTEQGVMRREKVRLASPGGAGSPAALGWQSAAAAPLPLGQLPVVFLMANVFRANGQAEDYGSAVGQMLGHIWPALLSVGLIGVLAAVAAYRRQQRYGLPHAVGWAVFAFLFGAPGWIAYRWRRTWPVLDDCPACGHLVPHDRDRCTDCLTPFPPPARKGIEVFA